MKTSLLRITILTALLSVSTAGLFAGPSQEFWKRKQAGRAAAKAAPAANTDAPACCPKTQCDAPGAKESAKPAGCTKAENAPVKGACCKS